MSQKKFSELFSKLEPNETTDRVLNAVKSYTTRRGESGNDLFYEFTVELDEIIEKKDLYALEDAICKAYGIFSVRIFPRYPAGLFTEDYVDEIIVESKRVGIIARGFFGSYSVSTADDGTIYVEIPFAQSGVDLLDLAKTAEVFSQIAAAEFGIEQKFSIGVREDYGEYRSTFEENVRKQMRRESEAAAMQYRAYMDELQRQELAGKAQEEEKKAAQLPFRASLFDGDKEVSHKDDGTICSGKMTFDVSNPETVVGDVFTFENAKPIRALFSAQRDIVALGEVFEITEREIRKTNKIVISVGVTDGDASIFVKKTLDPDAAAEFVDLIKKGASYAFHGDVKKDRFDGEFYVDQKDIQKVSRVLRRDNSEEKRVELHLHTTLSAMDATIKPEDAVKTAVRFGHPAVAITDHGNLQAFPIAMETKEKLKKDKDVDIKILYGVEAYFVDDTARALFGDNANRFTDEFIFFDIETTGLSALNCEITEIGAVKMKNGEVLDKFNMLVNPGVPIPAEIVRLTGITDEMVKNEPPISEVLPKFLDFIGDGVLVAHNASFDAGFISQAAHRLGLPFPNPYLDTVAMSRYVNPELQKHKLDILADYFHLGDFNHHRASDDAEMLAAIFYKMAEKLADEGIYDLDAMADAMSERSDPLKLPSYHQIILVKNQTGLKNLYRLVSDSYLKYYKRNPRIPKTALEANREGLIVGSACEAGELYRAILDNKPQEAIEEIARFYDYLEIQPLSNNSFLIEIGKVANEQALRDINRRIYDLGKKLGIPVCATCDAHYLDDDDHIYRSIILAGMKYNDYARDNHLYFRTTDEMLEEFSYLGEDAAREVVIENPNKIAAMIEDVRPIPDGKFDPHIDGAEEELTTKCHELAKQLYGDPLPKEVSERLERELDAIITNGFAIMYIIARKLVENSEAAGYQVGSRGSVGSSFAATMAGITKVNPLPPHYRCPKCRHTEFFTDGSVGSGFDLPPKKCPECQTPLERDGHDIPFETFLGFKGDKVPDIDLNFSGDVQSDAHRFTEVLFGKGHAFRAGTLGTLADKTAFGYVMKYVESLGISVSRAEVERLMTGITGIKRTTGQHPGGVIIVPAEYDVYDFTPIQHPADDPNSDIITTHFAFTYLHDTILKLDILGHDIPTKIKRLEEYTGTSVLDVPLSDPKVYRLFTSTEPLGIEPDALFDCKTGTLGLPEMGTNFVRGVLMSAQPKNFANLLQIEGLTHGTNCWQGNADELIKNGICTISDVIGCRDDIMMTLIHKYKMDKSLSFKIMEFVRKNKKGVIIPQEMQDAMREANVPEWYIDSLQKIRYMFPKAHAAAYAIDALRLGWYKVYYPCEFYAAYFSAAPDGFEAQSVMGGVSAVRAEVEALDKKKKSGADFSQKDAACFDALQIVLEYYARGLKFLPVDLKRSHATKFLPENGSIRLPFASLAGLAEASATGITDARDRGEITSVDQLKREAKLSKTVVELLMDQGVFDELTETNQIGMFSIRETREAKKAAQAQEKAAPAAPKAAEKPADDGDGGQISMF